MAPFLGKKTRRLTSGFAVPTVLILAAAVVTGCSGSPQAASTSSPTPSAPVVHIPPQTSGVLVTAPDGRGAIRPLPPLTGCTRTATDPVSAHEMLTGVVPGSKICIIGDLHGWRMKVAYSGTDQAPIQVVGDGQTRVNGIDIQAFNVVVDGFTVLNAKSPEIQINGNNVTLRNTVARNPIRPGSDNIQLTGDNITISHNTLGEDSGDGGRPNGGGTKANCIDIVTDDSDPRPSHHVRIEGNRCENTAINCLRAFSRQPTSSGRGNGATSDIAFTNNYCQTRGSTGVAADNVQNITITGNEIAQLDHAWTLQNNSIGAQVHDNALAPGTRYEVAVDGSSQPGYRGPTAGGTP